MPVHRLYDNPRTKVQQTACGIKFVAVIEASSGRTYGRNNGMVEVTATGQPFDCQRCKHVLETFTGKRYPTGDSTR